LAVLALPWQTRWFQEGPRLAGYPWEEGRISVYGSELLMIATIILGLFVLLARQKTDQVKRTHPSRTVLIVLGVSFFAFSFFTTSSLRGTTEWWMEALVLGAFFWTLKQWVSLREFSFWFVLSLLPHALLGIWQAMSQQAVGAALLGIAAQEPAVRGVAVIEAGGLRWLRSYGGFPHPNILGGWLVVGVLVASVALKEQLLARKQRIFYYLSLVVCSLGLVFSYSRSAWLSLVLFLGVSALSLLFSREKTHRLQSLLVMSLILLSCMSAILIRPNLIFVRAQTETRLEQKSLSERAQGIQNGLRILREHPFVGSGFGANGLVIAELDLKEGHAPTIPISPHFIPLLAAAELGLVGMALLFVILLFLLRIRDGLIQRRHFFSLSTILPLLVLLPIPCVDHYLWSYWSGKVLCFVAFFLVYAAYKNLEKMPFYTIPPLDGK
jgi:O-antigen ligase